VYDLGGDKLPNVANASASAQPDGVTGRPAGLDLDGDYVEVLNEHGRGLAAVSRLASEVGVDGDRTAGHLVWALLGDPTSAGRCHDRPM